MAVPKRRVSKTRALKRKTHYKIKLATPVKDKDGSWKVPHRINKFSGLYKQIHSPRKFRKDTKSIFKDT